jgi:hypothetical protein
MWRGAAYFTSTIHPPFWFIPPPNPNQWSFLSPFVPRLEDKEKILGFTNSTTMSRIGNGLLSAVFHWRLWYPERNKHLRGRKALTQIQLFQSSTESSLSIKSELASFAMQESGSYFGAESNDRILRQKNKFLNGDVLLAALYCIALHLCSVLLSLKLK